MSATPSLATHRTSRRVFTATIAGSLLAAPMFTFRAAAQDSSLKALATFSVLHDWVQNVAGDLIDLSVLVPAGGDTHTFDPAPDQVAELTDAKLIFEIGLGFESWLDNIFAASGSSAERVVVSEGIAVRTLTEGEEGHEHEEGEDDHDDHEDESATPADEHDHGDTDPHIWGNVQNAIIAIGTIRDALIAADPDNTDAYTANAEAYLGELETLDAWVKSEVAKIPEEDRKLVTSHDALGYYTDAYGFTIVGTVLGLTTEEAEPSAQQVAELVQQIQDSGVKAIFAETIENPAVIEAIAAEAGVVVGPELYTDALGEAGSDGDTYIKMITFNTNAIVSAILGE